MSRASIAEVQRNLPEYLEHARREPVEIEENGVVMGCLVSGYDPDDEILMSWLSLPDVKARFEASRAGAAQGATIPRAEALQELGITEEELAVERERLG
jgi:hypothetical protein